MIGSLALIFLLGLLLAGLCNRLKIPGFLGLLLAGIILGPFFLNLIDPTLLKIAPDLRTFALIIILLRAGFNLKIEDLKAIGRPALLLCFLPALMEFLAIIVLGQVIFSLPLETAMILAAVVTAVSPAVIIPMMLKLLNEGYGRLTKVPQLVMAGSAVEDIFVLVLFSVLLGLRSSGGDSVLSSLGTIPVALVLGMLGGVLLGFVIVKLFRSLTLTTVLKVLVVLGVSFLLVAGEKWLQGIVPFSGLLGIMALGITILNLAPKEGLGLAKAFSSIWVGAEVLLFVLVGVSVNLGVILKVGPIVILLIGGALVMRSIGVSLSLVKSSLNYKERFFVMIAYLPKATVQAAIGGVPLSLGMPYGELILAIAVVSIFITAPLGAIGMNLSYRGLLKRDLDKTQTRG